MKKIKNSSVNQKDRIICETTSNIYKFYYESYKSNEQLYLFKKDRSPSISSFFEDYGVRMNGVNYSMTLKQFYEHRKLYRNHKLKEIFDRIPSMVTYVLNERDEMMKEQVKHNNRVKNADKVIYDDREFAA